MFCDIRSCVSVAWLNTLLLHYTIISIASWLYKTDIKTYRELKKKQDYNFEFRNKGNVCFRLSKLAILNDS